jgi:hypothetical protein
VACCTHPKYLSQSATPERICRIVNVRAKAKKSPNAIPLSSPCLKTKTGQGHNLVSSSRILKVYVIHKKKQYVVKRTEDFTLEPWSTSGHLCEHRNRMMTSKFISIYMFRTVRFQAWLI